MGACPCHASGRCCDDATRFAIARSVAVASAVNHGYRFEEARKRALDAWYWDRQNNGASFLTNWRLAVAADLLTETRIPIAQIATEVGYTNSFAFSTAFKRRYGTSPQQRRRIA